jgi:hypothetical protein
VATAPPVIEWHAARRKGRRTVVRLMNDPVAVRDLAAWLSRETGLELEDRSRPEARAIQLAELRDALEKSGSLREVGGQAGGSIGRGAQAGRLEVR